MRPVKVEMQAFGSYGKQETIPFDSLKQNLFLVAGSTGSGKTTIFDAIVFALYGESSSNVNKKDGRELQSQFAPLLEPFVELTFTEKGETYAVRRVPAHTRPKKRGEGTMDIAGSVSLTMPDGTVYPQKETNKKIEELIGLTKAQFMQVAMLAQGEFMEVLRAKSDKKKETFRRLFNTGLYEDITAELKKRRDDMNAEVSLIHNDCRSAAHRIAVPAEYARREELNAARSRIALPGELRIPDLEQLLDELRLLCEDLTASGASAAAERDAADNARAEAQRAFAKGQELEKIYDQLKQAEKTQAACAAREPEIAAAEELRKKLLAAWDLHSAWQPYHTAAETAKKTARALEEQQAALPGLRKAFEETAESERKAKETFDRENADCSRVEENVQAALACFEKIRAAKKDADAKKASAEKADRNRQAAAKELADFEAREQEWRLTEADLRQTPAKLENWKARKQEAEALQGDIGRLRTLENNVSGSRKQAEKAAEDYEAAREDYSRKNDAYLQAQSAFLDAQAGILARDRLRPGEPCPVCGSRTHPHPCELAQEHQNLTQEEVDSLLQEAEAARKAMENAAGKAGSRRSTLENQETQLRVSTAALRNRMLGSLPEAPEDLSADAAGRLVTAWLAQLAAEGAAFNSDNSRLEDVRKKLSGAGEQKQILKQAAEQAGNAAADAENAAVSAASSLHTLEQQQSYSSEAAAISERDAAGAKKAAAEKAYISAKKSAEKAKTAKENGETLIGKYTADLSGQQAEEARLHAAYQAALAEKAMTEEEWKSVTALHTRGMAEQLQQKITRHKQDTAAAEATRKAAAESIHGRPEPDMAALRKALDRADTEYTRLSGIAENVRNDCRIDLEIQKTLVSGMAERKDLVEKRARVSSLYDRLSGSVKGAAKVDIETFVQRYHLKRILVYANRRFSKMTGGQYELRLSEIDQTDRQSNHGLDLTVYSTVTGRTREIRTLSGGESFMAALALSLGMADQIRMNSGAVRPDILFIDEGFGSLDDHSRNQAVNVLKEMAGGDRLIGIISHVSELKQEIDDQLVVSKDDHGSHTEWRHS